MTAADLAAVLTAATAFITALLAVWHAVHARKTAGAARALAIKVGSAGDSVGQRKE